MTDVSISGLSDLHKLLQELPAKVEGNIMVGALRAGQNVIKEEAMSKVPVKSCALRRSIKVSLQRKSKKFGWVRVHLTAGNREAWYAHFLEYGTASYYSGTGSRSKRKPYEIKAKDGGALRMPNGAMVAKVVHPGIKPKPFMRQAFDAAQGRALDATVAYIKRRLAKEVVKK